MQPIKWEEGRLLLIDQTRLPHQEDWLSCTSYREVAEAIKTMQVRGAPAIGIAAAFGLVLGAQEYAHLQAQDFQQKLQEIAAELAATRPTAVNLFWALEKMAQVVDELAGQNPSLIVRELERAAGQMLAEDLAINKQIGNYGQELFPSPARVLTHCNAGALATAGYGTALGVIRAAHAAGKVQQVYASETRPLLQGARLTAWELHREGIPVTLITDNMAGYLLQQKMVDLVIVGADRIAQNGDVANKIGTYSLAVLAHANSIPFYVAAPISTFDFNISTGREIPIEERDPREVTCLMGQSIAPEGVAVFNPAFDITPAQYITAIITEAGILRPPYGEGIAALRSEKRS
ncbi:MAG: S-methyl-5-thioribose-1-phosphate isomerase [bacterium]